MDKFLDDEGKLEHGFTSAEALEEVDIGDGDRPRPTFISTKLDPEYKRELLKLLKEYKIVLLESIMRCLAWIDLFLSIGCLLNLGISRFSRVQDGVILKFCQI